MNSGTDTPKLAFSWNGLPQYAARLIRRSIDVLGEPCVVVGSEPSVPISGVEMALEQKVYWVDPAVRLSWSELGLEVPEVFVQSGWSYPAFTSLGKEVKKSGGTIIGLSDANWRRDLRQLVIGPLYFRLFLRRRFDAFLVPGRQGKKLLQYLGMEESVVYTGMYAADSKLFPPGPPIQERPKQFLYVGQFIDRKNVLLLCEVFLQFSKRQPDWTLKLCGSGELFKQIPVSDKILLESFVQPEELAKVFHESRFLILPSKKEAWGLVVHEACLTGTALLLSDAVGSADDFLCNKNGFAFSFNDRDALLASMLAAAECDEAWFREAQAISLERSAQFSTDRFAATILKIIDRG